MNRRSFLRLGAVAAGGLIVGEEVRDWLEWQSRRVFALGGIPEAPRWTALNTAPASGVITDAMIRRAFEEIRKGTPPAYPIVSRHGRVIGWTS